MRTIKTSIALTLVTLLVLVSSISWADDSDSENDSDTVAQKISGLPHKQKDGKDEDSQAEIVAWQKKTLRTLILDSAPKTSISLKVPASNDLTPKWVDTLKGLIRFYSVSKDLESRACFLLNLSIIPESIFLESDPSFGTLSEASRDKLASVGVLSKQVIGNDINYAATNDFLARVLKEASHTRCGAIAKIKKLSLGGHIDESCRDDQYQKVIEQGTELLKEKSLKSIEKSLIYSYLAQAYQTQWALAFEDETDSFNPTQYVSLHPQAKLSAVKYYNLLSTNVPELKEVAKYLAGRFNEKVNLGAMFSCPQE